MDKEAFFSRPSMMPNNYNEPYDEPMEEYIPEYEPGPNDDYGFTDDYNNFAEDDGYWWY